MSVEKMLIKAKELKSKGHSTREICQEMHLSQATVEWLLAKQASDNCRGPEKESTTEPQNHAFVLPFFSQDTSGPTWSPDAPSWSMFAPIWAHLGPMLVHLGADLGLPRAHIDPCWASYSHPGYLGAFSWDTWH